MIESLRCIEQTPEYTEKVLEKSTQDGKRTSEEFSLDWDKCMSHAVSSWGVFTGHEETIIDQEFQMETSYYPNPADSLTQKIVQPPPPPP
eukprot:623797-Hanusia_phi.AAC.1